MGDLQVDDATAGTVEGLLADALGQLEPHVPAPGAGCGSGRVDEALESFCAWAEIGSRMHATVVRSLRAAVDQLALSWSQVDAQLRADATGALGG